MLKQVAIMPTMTVSALYTVTHCKYRYSTVVTNFYGFTEFKAIVDVWNNGDIRWYK